MKRLLEQIPVLVLMIERAAVLVLIACAVGLIVNAVHPMGLPIMLGRVPHEGIPVRVWERVHVVNPAQAHDLWQHHAMVFVDARDSKDFKIGHIPASSPKTPTISLPFHEFGKTYPTVAGALPQHGPMLVYCYGSECGLAMRVVKRLLALGYDNLSSLQGGIAGWGRAGYELTGPLAHRGKIEFTPAATQGAKQ
jgi:rhodanese-related sulfurtransferase